LQGNLRAARLAAAAASWSELEVISAKLVETCPSSPRSHYWLGVARFNENQFFAAIRSLRRAIELKDDAPARLALARAYAALNQRQFFKEEIEIAKRLAPKDASMYFTEGKYYYERENRPDLAEVALRRAIELRPKRVDVRCCLALCLKAIGRLHEAETLLAETVGLADGSRRSDYLPYQLLAELYLADEKADQALPLITRAITMEPNSPAGHFLLGKTQWKLKNEKAAIASLQKAIALDADFPDPRYLLSQIYRSTGDRKQAERQLADFEQLEKLYGRTAK
jgi:Flp pilus assembly protein TadD